MTRSFKIWMLLGACLFVTACTNDGTWGWYVIDPTTAQGQSNVRFLIGGFWATIQLSLIATALSMTIGLLVALPGMSSNRWIRLPSRVYIEFVRAIPLLPMLFWVFYGLPVVMRSLGFPITIDAFWGTVGLTYSQTMRYVILPQAIRRILPPLANQFIYIVKMSPLPRSSGCRN